jgi:8-oxo-dGTP pyrophosphatase MutT (NUDIX family)
MRFSCGIFLMNKIGQVLICHVTNADFWSIPKGLVDAGETYEAAAIRELFEETSIKLEDLNIDGLTPLGIFPFKSGKKNLVPFLVNFDDDWTKIDTVCHSMVTNRPIPFPEVDEFIWADYTLCKKMLHYTQHDALDIVYNKK